MTKLKVGLILYPLFSPFHISVPQMIFGSIFPEDLLFDLYLVAPDGEVAKAERGMQAQPDGGLELLNTMDIIIVPGWHKLDEPPAANLMESLIAAYQRGAYLVGLCYGTYALAYAGLLNEKKACTHWLAEQDFNRRFPGVHLDTNALYTEDDRIITSAGIGAGLDCCLYIVRKFFGAKIANRVARLLVVPPHREGGQAQFIEYPIARSTSEAQINTLLDYLRKNIAKSQNIDELSALAGMSRRTFTRRFQKATGMTVVEWLIKERLQRSRELLETTALSIEQIATQVGFQTATSFRQHFKQRHAVSPGAWRKTFGTEKLIDTNEPFAVKKKTSQG